MGQTLTNLLTHLVFGTKGRAPLIHADIRSRLWAYLGGILGELKAPAITIGGTADHVHMLVAMASTLSVAEAMRVVKANSSRWVHETWPAREGFAWQTGYGAFAVSESNRQAVTLYINSQEEHHHRLSFRDELRLLLDKHGVAYDERYL